MVGTSKRTYLENLFVVVLMANAVNISTGFMAIPNHRSISLDLNLIQREYRSRSSNTISSISISPTATATTTTMKMSLMENVEKLLIGNIFPSEDIQEEDPYKQLATFDTMAIGSPRDISVAHHSLESFLLSWGKRLEADADNKKQQSDLITPVYCVSSLPRTFLRREEEGEEFDDMDIKEGFRNILHILEHDDGGGGGDDDAESQVEVIKTSGVKLSFRKTKRYLSRNEQRGLEKGQIPDRKGAKIDSWSPGGIQLYIQTVHVSVDDNAQGNVQDMGAAEEQTIEQLQRRQKLRLFAFRCDIDGDTVVKVSSEKKIIRSLREAIRIWHKMRTL